MPSFAPLPTEQGIAFNVKNTFVNVESDEEDAEPQPAFVRRSTSEPRSRKGSMATEPPSRKSSIATEYCSQDGQDSEHSSQPAFSRQQSGSSDGERAGCVAPTRADALAGRAAFILDADERDESEEESEDEQSDQERRGAGRVAFTVKNTFVDIADDDEPARLARCHSHPPSRGASLLEELVEPEDVEAAQEGSGSPWPGAGVASIPVESLMPGTPTPRGTRSQPPAFFSGEARPIQVAAPTQAARPQQQQANQGGGLAPITAAATDKSLAVTQNRVACRVEWTVDAKKIRGSEKNIVSMPFDVVMSPGTDPVVFKLMVYPKAVAGSGGSSFRKAHGIGYVQLKCCSDIPENANRATAVSVSVGSRGSAQGSRGPFEHSFCSSSMFNLPRAQADWNLSAAVERSTAAFAVAVEIAPLE